MARAGVEEEVVEPNVFVVVQIRPGSQCQLSARSCHSIGELVCPKVAVRLLADEHRSHRERSKGLEHIFYVP